MSCELEKNNSKLITQNSELTTTHREGTMIIVREVFQAKYGRGDEVVALFKELRERVMPDYSYRILTDASGQFFTVTTETEVESLAAWEKLISEAFSDPDFGEWFARMMPLVETG